jgi:hypothetical protein
LIEGFLKENYTTEVFEGTGCGEEKLTKGSPVLLNILDINA